MAVSIAIQQSSKGIEENLLNRIGGKVLLKSPITDQNQIYALSDEDYEKAWKEFIDFYENLSSKEKVSYADIHYHYNSIQLLDSEKYDLHNKHYENGSYLHGVDSPVFTDEKEELLTLNKGSYFTKEMLDDGWDVMIISDQVTRDQVPFQIGDRIDFSLILTAYDPTQSQTVSVYERVISYEIVGIYQQIDNKYSDIQNDLELFYVPNQNLVKYEQFAKDFFSKSNMEPNRDRLWIESCMFRVHSLLDLPVFKNTVLNEIEDKQINFYTSEDSVEGLLGTIKTLSSLSENVLWFSMGAMCIAVALVTFYFIKERKHEIGIYLSLGMNKKELLIQIVFETLFVGLLGIILSIGSQKYLSQSFSDYLVETMIRYEDTEKDKFVTNHHVLNPDHLTHEDIVSQYEVHIQGQDLILLLILGSCTLIISCLLPLGYIVILKPKNIMLE